MSRSIYVAPGHLLIDFQLWTEKRLVDDDTLEQWESVK